MVLNDVHKALTADNVVITNPNVTGNPPLPTPAPIEPNPKATPERSEKTEKSEKSDKSEKTRVTSRKSATGMRPLKSFLNLEPKTHSKLLYPGWRLATESLHKEQPKP